MRPYPCAWVTCFQGGVQAKKKRDKQENVELRWTFWWTQDEARERGRLGTSGRVESGEVTVSEGWSDREKSIPKWGQLVQRPQGRMQGGHRVGGWAWARWKEVGAGRPACPGSFRQTRHSGATSTYRVPNSPVLNNFLETRCIPFISSS